MSKLRVREVSNIVRNYFDEIKKTKFLFDIICVDFKRKKNLWRIECEVANIFDENPRHYIVYVDDNTGDIMNLCEYEE